MSENGYVSPFVGDGYDRTATIAEMPGMWSRVRIRYRLAPALEVSSAFVQAMQDEQNAVKYHAKLLATRILDWDIKDHTGAKVKVSADAILGLHYSFYGALRSIVYGEVRAEDEGTGDQHDTKDDDLKN
jgi:hypothetical protein